MDANEEAQALGVGRVHRPASRGSSRSRYTPQSSNSSATNLQHRNQSGMRDRERILDRSQTDRRESPGALLLQERLKEKKAARLNERRRSIEIDGLGDGRGMHSTPRDGATSRPGRDRDMTPSSSGERTAGKKGMGIKEMEETVSTLHKQNFDLKLELFHRRQRQSALEERLEAAEARISEQAEMQAINEQLLAELEKRDQAIDEAMNMIANLEAKVEKLEEERSAVRSFDMQYESSYFQRSHEDVGESMSGVSQPNRTGKGHDLPTETKLSDAAPRSVARMPSFLSDQSEGADALRSLYVPGHHQSRSLLSLPRLQEENGNSDRPEEGDGMNSPRLSVLSESSFLSVYGEREKSLALEGLDLNEGAESINPDRRRHRKSLSIERWVDERANATQIAPRRVPSPKAANLRNGQFSTIDTILESPLQRLERLQRTLLRSNVSVGPRRLFNEPLSQEQHNSSRKAEKESERDALRYTEMTSFERQQALPPTPDTISTNTLRRFKTSTETLDHDTSEREHDWEQAQLDRLDAFPLYNRPTSVRPHSAGETVTSRREGHGWDTVTQSEVTETNSDMGAEVPSAFDPWIAMGREKARPKIQPPDMFTFGPDDDDEWGRDMMFNHDKSHTLPPLRNNERSGNRHREPGSEGTVLPSPNLRRSISTYEAAKYPIPNPGFAQQSSPNPPERRSSLAISPAGHEKRPRKSQSSAPSASHSITEKALQPLGSNPFQKQESPKKSRIASRLFSLGRSDSFPATTPAGPVVHPGISNSSIKREFSATQSYNEYARAPRARRNNSMDSRSGIEGLHGASATPPPISRYPKGRDGSGAGIVRPMTASSLESKLHSGARQKSFYDDGFGVDGAGEVREAPSGGGNGSTKGDGRGGVKKWFGLGKSGSMKR